MELLDIRTRAWIVSCKKEIATFKQILKVRTNYCKVRSWIEIWRRKIVSPLRQGNVNFLTNALTPYTTSSFIQETKMERNILLPIYFWSTRIWQIKNSHLQVFWKTAFLQTKYYLEMKYAKIIEACKKLKTIKAILHSGKTITHNFNRSFYAKHFFNYNTNIHFDILTNY